MNDEQKISEAAELPVSKAFDRAADAAESAIGTANALMSALRIWYREPHGPACFCVRCGATRAALNTAALAASEELPFPAHVDKETNA